jgi:hypothetical protein
MMQLGLQRLKFYWVILKQLSVGHAVETLIYVSSFILPKVAVCTSVLSYEWISRGPISVEFCIQMGLE